eukprot:5548727-Alexandrium_andersonii.AAC.1
MPACTRARACVCACVCVPACARACAHVRLTRQLVAPCVAHLPEQLGGDHPSEHLMEEHVCACAHVRIVCTFAFACRACRSECACRPCYLSKARFLPPWFH